MNVTGTGNTHLDINQPLYIRIPEAIRLFGISRAKLYQLMGARKFRSVSLREPGQTRATRLIDLASLKSFLESLYEITGEETES